MAFTTVKVPVELRDRLAESARRDKVSMATVIDRALDSAEDVQFWERVAATMPPGAGESERQVAESALSDGLDPNENWDDIL
ncbi:MAG: hypothetical protein LBK95_20630 [Bifidobacteriaceae bacterium]|jgi:predicted transcriptional regulator|nr:hypothetical protein [Bifidobacteriaceae bacterium]